MCFSFLQNIYAYNIYAMTPIAHISTSRPYCFASRTSGAAQKHNVIVGLLVNYHNVLINLLQKYQTDEAKSLNKHEKCENCKQLVR